jgi:hypothetical protein
VGTGTANAPGLGEALFLIAAARAARLYFEVCVVPADGAGKRKQFQANQRLVPVGLDFIGTNQKQGEIK